MSNNPRENRRAREQDVNHATSYRKSGPSHVAGNSSKNFKPVDTAYSRRKTSGSRPSVHARKPADKSDRFTPVRRAPAANSKQKKRTKHRRVLTVAIVAVLILVLAGAGVAYAAIDLKNKAGAVKDQAYAVAGCIMNEDFDGAVSAAAEAKYVSDDLKNTLHNPFWTAVSNIPYVGQDVSTAGIAVDALRVATGDALVPMTLALQLNPIDALIGDDKSVNLQSLESLLEKASDVSGAIQECTDMIAGMPDFNIPQLQSAFGDAKDKVVNLNEIYQQVCKMGPTLTELLGSDGDKTYMLMAQNNAELRSGGGYPANIGTIEIQNGKIEFGDFVPVLENMYWEIPPEFTVSDVEHTLFDDKYKHLDRTQDFNMHPDYTRVAPVWAKAYENTQTFVTKKPYEVDGVISIVPSVVQDILGIIGPITLSDGTVLDGNNATKVLLHDIYWKYYAGFVENGNAIADGLFSETAEKALTGLFSNLNSGALVDFVQVLLEDIDERKFMIWVKDEQTQQALSDMGWSGSIVGEEETPELGVYVTTPIPSKMGWFLDIDTKISDGVENTDGTTTYSVTSTVTNTCTEQERETGTEYIVGIYVKEAYGDLEYGDMHPLVQFVAPVGGSIGEVTSNSNAAHIVRGKYEGMDIVRVDSPLNARDSVTYTYTVTVPSTATSPLALTGTPLLSEFRDS